VVSFPIALPLNPLKGLPAHLIERWAAPSGDRGVALANLFMLVCVFLIMDVSYVLFFDIEKRFEIYFNKNTEKNLFRLFL